MMNPKLDNEKGYTLLLAILIGTLFSIIAVSLITITTTGINKNNLREDYQQATTLSEKGLTHIISQINTNLKNKIGEDGLDQDTFIAEMKNELESLKCIKDDGSIHSENETGQYEVCVLHYEDAEDTPTRQKVVFKSVGKADGMEQANESTVIIGANGVPDALNYAIGSHCDNESCNDFDGEGNLFLHGGVQVEGDLKVDGNLITSNKGYAYLGGERWIDSLYPTIKTGPGDKSDKARLVLGKDVYSFNSNPPNRRSYANHINLKNFNNYSRETNSLNNAFTIAPSIIEREPIHDDIIIEEKEDSYKYNRNQADVVINGSSINGKNYDSSRVYPYYESCFLWKCSEVDTYVINGTNSFKGFATNKNVRINNRGNQETHLTIGNSDSGSYEGGMYVGGNLTIGNTSTTSHNTSNYDDVSISGNIYVDGDLEIRGANIDFNSIIYVTGKVNVQYSTINGLTKRDGSKGSLILFADEEIYFANNSVNQDDPSNITGYFYSNDKFEMFGVGSNIRIEGGISARRIVLNAIRGRAKSNRFANSQRITSNDFFEGVNGQKERDSRLQVIYNPGIIGTYSDLQLEEPIIKGVDPPQLIDRE